MLTLRTRLLAVGCICAVLMAAGCTTTAIEAHHYYTEKVSSILMSQDKHKIVFIGENHHYVFDAPPGIVATLEDPFHAKVSGMLSDFHVDDQGAVTGLYTLHVSGELNQKDSRDAAEAGYLPDASGQLTLAGKITGTRYQEDKSLAGAIHALRHPEQPLVDEKSSAPESLNKTYKITVTYDPSVGEQAADKLISPIIISSDGLYLLFNLVLAPVVIPIAASKVSPDCVPYCMSTFK